MAAAATPKEAKFPAVWRAPAAPEDLEALTLLDAEAAVPVERLLLEPEDEEVAELRVLVT
jgi:hypothetical protein